MKRGPRPVQLKVFSVEEIHLMLELEVQYHGNRFIAATMAADGRIDKSAKQIRDKRAIPTYKAIREEYLARHLPGSAAIPDNERNVGDAQNVSREEDVLINQNQAATLPVDEDPPRLDYRRLEIRHEAQDSAPGDTDWREGPSKQNTHPEGRSLPSQQQQSSCCGMPFNMPESQREKFLQAHVDHIYDLATSHLRSNGAREGTRHPQKGSGKGREPRRRYLYARTQGLLKKTQALLRKMLGTASTGSWIIRRREQVVHRVVGATTCDRSS
ncbi:unnamed protein product [Brassicogethes aeneus]|uniref:Uncharacterized protein n=1 Tax=Brassicogethes aeneus TaxID=1431903 RepID=A0A9P0FMA5_BRAAE|nr:unnamed protein product [Brassicogethes aeneus]